MSAKDYVDSH